MGPPLTIWAIFWIDARIFSLRMMCLKNEECALERDTRKPEKVSDRLRASRPGFEFG